MRPSAAPRTALRTVLLLVVALVPAGCEIVDAFDTGPARHLEEQVGTWTLERFERTDYRGAAVARRLVVEDAGTFELGLGSTDPYGREEFVHTANDFAYDLVPAVEPAFLLYLGQKTHVNPRKGQIYWHTDDDDRERLYVWYVELNATSYVILTVDEQGDDVQTWHFIQNLYVDGASVRVEEAYHVRRR